WGLLSAIRKKAVTNITKVEPIHDREDSGTEVSTRSRNFVLRSGSSGSISTQPHLVISRLRDNSYCRMTAADVQQIATPQNLGQVITIGTNPQRDCESSTRYRSNSIPGTQDTGHWAKECANSRSKQFVGEADPRI